MQIASPHTPVRIYPQPDRLTRDRQLVGFVARHGVVTIPHVMEALGVGRASAYRRVAHCIDRGLLERLELLRREPSVLRATRRGLRFAGLGGMPLAEVSATSADHSLRCASVALALAREPGVRRVLSERELIFAERTEGRPIASARVGDRPDGGPRFHRPDLVLLTDRLPIAIEVELSGKGRRRLEQIIRGWRRADSVGEVRYYCGVVEYMNPERLDALASKAGGPNAERVSAYVDGLSARSAADLGGGRDRLAVLAEGELGPWLDPALGTGETLDIAASIRAGEVLYFHLDADRYPAASKLLAAALLIDLVGLTATGQHSELGALLVIDEFAALAAEQVSRLFARARSAGLSLLLGTQSLADLRGARPDDPSDTLTEQVLSNIEFGVIHRIGDPDSAERLARLAGTAPAWTVTQRVSGTAMPFTTGEGTRTREREFVVGPDQFKRLGTGEAIVINSKARCPAEIVRIWPPRRGGEG